MCSTNLSKDIDGNLHVACTMNVLEVGTIGGGTFLDCQQTCLRVSRYWNYDVFFGFFKIV